MNMTDHKTTSVMQSTIVFLNPFNTLILLMTNDFKKSKRKDYLSINENVFRVYVIRSLQKLRSCVIGHQIGHRYGAL